MITLDALRGTSGRRYVGITNNLVRRLNEHRLPRTSAGRLLDEFQVVHTEEYPDYAQARVRARLLKSGHIRKWLDEHFPRTGSA